MDTCSSCFYFRPSGTLKKAALGRPSKLDSFFDGFWELPGGRQEGSRVSESSIFTFSVGPQNASKMEAKMKRFGFSNPSCTRFRGSGSGFGASKGDIENGVSKWMPFGRPAAHPARRGTGGVNIGSQTHPRGGQQEGSRHQSHMPGDPEGVGGY